MCSPVAALMAVQVAGGVQSAIAENEKGKAEEKYYKFLAGQKDQQAILALQRADQSSKIIQDRAASEIGQMKDEASRLRGRQKTALVANGVGLGSVTALDLMEDSDRTAFLDEIAVRYNADSNSWVARTEGANEAWAARSEASSLRTAGKNAREAGRMNAVSSLLGSATTVASTGLQMGSKGAAPSYAIVNGRRVPVARPNQVNR